MTEPLPADRPQEPESRDALRALMDSASSSGFSLDEVLRVSGLLDLLQATCQERDTLRMALGMACNDAWFDARQAERGYIEQAAAMLREVPANPGGEP